MGKHRNILSSITVAAVFLSASPANAQGGYIGNPAYNTRFYSDASKTTQIGTIMWTGCDDYDSPQYRRFGSMSNHHEDEHVGYCYYGQMMPV
jgi:hypothetical protein